MKKQWLIIFYAWMVVVPIFCIVLDLFMSTISPTISKNGNQNPTSYFDLSVINQFVYFSVWVTLGIAVFGLVNLINLFTNKMPRWLTTKNNHTFITSMGIIIMIAYSLMLIFNPERENRFGVWYKTLKTILEHFITPLLLIVLYFFHPTGMVKTRNYAKKTGWITIIFPVVYVLVVVIRAAMLYKYGPKSDYLTWNQTRSWKEGVPIIFPYGLNPWEKPAYLWAPALVLLIFSPYALGNLLNFLSNKSMKVFSTRKSDTPPKRSKAH